MSDKQKLESLLQQDNAPLLPLRGPDPKLSQTALSIAPPFIIFKVGLEFFVFQLPSFVSKYYSKISSSVQ